MSESHGIGQHPALSDENTAQRLRERKRELDLAMEAGNWQAVGDLAVLTSDESFTWTTPDELNMTTTSLDRKSSLEDDFLSKEERTGEVRLQSADRASNSEDRPTDADQSKNQDRNEAMDTNHNVNNHLTSFVELEDPSSFFVEVQRENQETRSQRRPERWIILALSCILMTGVYYSFDIPAALHQELKDYMPPSLKFEVQFNLLYSVYSIPNMFLPFFAGNVVDRLGASRCLLGCAGLTLLGQFWFAIGTKKRNWILMLLGRTVYGFGGESSCVAYSTLLSRWFAGGEVALSFGVALAVSRLGSVLNNFLSPRVAHTGSTPWALWTGLLFNALSTVAALIILQVDQRCSAGRRSTNDREDSLSEALLPTGESAGSENGPYQDTTIRVRVSDALRFGPFFWLLSVSCLVVYGCVLPFNNIASGILMERSYFSNPPRDCVLQFPNQCTSGSLQNHTNPSMDENGNVCPPRNYAPVLPTSLNITDSNGKPSYVIDSLSAKDVDCNSQFWAFGCTKDYCDAQHEATEKAGRVMSIPYFMSAILSPILGYVVDRVGQRAILASVSSFILILVHLVMGLSRWSPVLPLVGQGVAYSLYAAVLWPSVPLTVDDSVTGTAYGIIVCVQNAGLSFFPLVIAAIYNRNGRSYIPSVELFFVACAVAGFSVGILLNVQDRRSGNKLNGVSRGGGGDGEDSVHSEGTIFSDVHGEMFLRS